MKKLFIFMTAMALLSSNAASAATCNEKVINIISHSNGNIYFTTDQTCPSWCQLAGNPAFIKQSYAMFLTAGATDKTIAFAWNNLASCGEKNAVYAIPDFMVLAP
jgi:hypothetical protein